MRSSKNPANEETGQFALLKKLLPYPLYALFPILFIHFCFDPSSFLFSPSTTDQIPISNSIIISSPTPQDQIPSSNHIIISSPTPQDADAIQNNKESEKTTLSCDYSEGEWVPTKQEPLYNGSTCETLIKPGQNCMLFGRPDTDYLYYRWQPKHCKLPRFDPKTFLKLLKNKHVAFVGDSLARNQLESLLCLLSTASKPTLYYTGGEDNKFRKWSFPSPHNINVSIYWSPFLVKGIEKTSDYNFNTLFLDSVNEVWASDVKDIDMLLLSAGHWYLHPAVYHYNNTVLGCHYCPNYTEIGFYDVYGKALKTTFKSIVERTRNDITVFLTTFSPAHFEGEWDKLGACPKKAPYKENEQILEGMNEEMRKVGVEKVKEAQIMGKEIGRNNVRFVALDVTKLALMRPDGHPGPYMNPFPFANGVSERVQNDCVHWCLPGPIDAWNEILMDVIRSSWGTGEFYHKR